MKQWLTPLLIAVFAVVLALFDTGLVPAVGYPFRLVSFVFISALFTLIVIRDDFAFLLFCLGTTISWLAASETLLIPLAVGCAVLLLVSQSLERLFTNRTYYSIIAVASLGFVAYQAGLFLTFAIVGLLGGAAAHLATAAELAVGWLALAVVTTVSYLTTVLFSKKIRSYFIVGSN